MSHWNDDDIDCAAEALDSNGYGGLGDAVRALREALDHERSARSRVYLANAGGGLHSIHNTPESARAALADFTNAPKSKGVHVDTGQGQISDYMSSLSIYECEVFE